MIFSAKQMKTSLMTLMIHGREWAVYQASIDLIVLIPLIITRLEEDVSKSKVYGDVSPITEGLKAIQEAINGVLIYYLKDDVDSAIISLNISISNIDNIFSKNSPIFIFRFLHDITRVAPDFQFFLKYYRWDSEEQKDEDLKNLKPMNRGPLKIGCIIIGNRPGLRNHSSLWLMPKVSLKQCLEKGMKQMIEESKKMDKAMEKTI